MSYNTHIHTHVLEKSEIMALPAGRIINTLIDEYVYDELPERWLNGDQRMEPCHWFEELPRACAEDSGGSCTADFLSNFSGSTDGMKALIKVMAGKGFSCRTEMADPDMWYAGFYLTVNHENGRVEDWSWRWKRMRASANTMELAVCRAALMAVGHIY